MENSELLESRLYNAIEAFKELAPACCEGYEDCSKCPFKNTYKDLWMRDCKLEIMQSNMNNALKTLKMKK